jgi:hypothetical protein
MRLRHQTRRDDNHVSVRGLKELAQFFNTGDEQCLQISDRAVADSQSNNLRRRQSNSRESGEISILRCDIEVVLHRELPDRFVIRTSEAVVMDMVRAGEIRTEYCDQASRKILVKQDLHTNTSSAVAHVQPQTQGRRECRPW